MGSRKKNWDLYPSCLREMARVCRPASGKAVLLTQDKKCFSKVFSLSWRVITLVWSAVSASRKYDFHVKTKLERLRVRSCLHDDTPINRMASIESKCDKRKWKWTLLANITAVWARGIDRGTSICLCLDDTWRGLSGGGGKRGLSRGSARTSGGVDAGLIRFWNINHSHSTAATLDAVSWTTPLKIYPWRGFICSAGSVQNGGIVAEAAHCLGQCRWFTRRSVPAQADQRLVWPNSRRHLWITRLDTYTRRSGQQPALLGYAFALHYPTYVGWTYVKIFFANFNLFFFFFNFHLKWPNLVFLWAGKQKGKPLLTSLRIHEQTVTNCFSFVRRCTYWSGPWVHIYC